MNRIKSRPRGPRRLTLSQSMSLLGVLWLAIAAAPFAKQSVRDRAHIMIWGKKCNCCRQGAILKRISLFFGSK